MRCCLGLFFAPRRELSKCQGGRRQCSGGGSGVTVCATRSPPRLRFVGCAEQASHRHRRLRQKREVAVQPVAVQRVLQLQERRGMQLAHDHSPSQGGSGAGPPSHGQPAYEQGLGALAPCAQPTQAHLLRPVGRLLHASHAQDGARDDDPGGGAGPHRAGLHHDVPANQ